MARQRRKWQNHKRNSSIDAYTLSSKEEEELKSSRLL
jgi:hypothetical protein